MSKIKYTCYCKIGNKIDGSADVRVRKTDNLLSLVNHLDKDFPDWRWFNVWDKSKNKQVANFTKSNRPQTKQVQ